MSLKKIWPESVRDEIIGALWVIAALVAFLNQILWIKVIGFGFLFLGGIAILNSIACARKNGPTRIEAGEDINIQHFLSACIAEVEFVFPAGNGKIDPIVLNVDEQQFETPPTQEMVSRIILNEVYNWLRGQISISYTLKVKEGEENGTDS